jgi:hypothetical protein
LDPSCIAVVDSELKSGRSIRDIIDILENKYKNARIFYLVLGGVIHLKDKDKKELNINDFGWEVEENKYKPDFLAFYVNSPGFEPPGGIR